MGVIKSLMRRLIRRVLRQEVEWIVRQGTPTPDPLLMPLISSINSNTQKAPFFSGEETFIMQGSFVSSDSTVGAYSYIGFNCSITKAVVGRYVSIANDVEVGPGEHETTFISTSSLFYENPYEQLTKLPCSIEHDVWIGAGSIIRRGVKIGLGAVVGANSFVNRDVPPFAIVAGSPARLLGYRFDEKTINTITHSRWWEYPVEDARQIVNSIQRNLKRAP